MIDFCGALVALILLLPLLVLLSCFSWFSHRGKVWFWQERVGKDGRIFRMLKFRTMNDSRNHSGELLSDEERTTVLGRFLRKYSLDEIPQVFHVLSGEMSLVGPRPLVPQHVAGCTPEEQRRHAVRPGITGLAQVCGRNEIPFRLRFRYDVWYGEHISPALDLRILFATLRVIFQPERRKFGVNDLVNF